MANHPSTSRWVSCRVSPWPCGARIFGHIREGLLRDANAPHESRPKSQWDDWPTSFVPGDARSSSPLDIRYRPVPRVVITYEYGNRVARWKCQLQRSVQRIVDVATGIAHRGFLTEWHRVPETAIGLALVSSRVETRRNRLPPSAPLTRGSWLRTS